jgi:hypothetical protein
MYKSEFQYMMKADRKKMGYEYGEWVGSNFLKAYTAVWTWKNGNPQEHKVEFDRDFTSSEWFLTFHIGHPAKPVDNGYSFHCSTLNEDRRIPIHRFPKHS